MAACGCLRRCTLLWAGNISSLPGAPADARRPPLRRFLREALSVTWLILTRWSRPPIETEPEGDGKPVMVIPGLLANDFSTGLLRRTLRESGYRVYGWGSGTNLGARPDLLERLTRRLERVVEESGQKAGLVGWSLGGVYARELAKHRPELVDLVITMGAPFSGDIRANNAWRVYELLNDHKVDDPPIPITREQKPPMRTVAIWSRRDGIVAPASARGQPGEADETIEVRCTHMGYVTDPETLRTLVELLGD
jgi:pimeloyl-ACP methyl ester carboxylesterase